MSILNKETQLRVMWDLIIAFAIIVLIAFGVFQYIMWNKTIRTEANIIAIGNFLNQAQQAQAQKAPQPKPTPEIEQEKDATKD